MLRAPVNVWVPYTRLQPATQICLLGYPDANWVELEDDDSYRRYMADLWAVGETFVNVEHDIVWWPGALEALWECPEPWCMYGYHADEIIEDGCAYLGCTKLSAELIAGTPGLWAIPNDSAFPGWAVLDCHLTHYARKAGFAHHQHWPSVVNANPALLA